MEPSDPPCDPSVDLEAWVIQTRLAHGLPPRVEDPVVLACIFSVSISLRTAKEQRRGKVDYHPILPPASLLTQLAQEHILACLNAHGMSPKRRNLARPLLSDN
jgi:hypothetical protein